MFHVIHVSPNGKKSGYGDFDDQESATEYAEHLLATSNPAVGTAALVEDDSGRVVYTAGPAGAKTPPSPAPPPVKQRGKHADEAEGAAA